MKKNFLFILIAMVLPVCFSSCNKDDDDKTSGLSKNEFVTMVSLSDELIQLYDLKIDYVIGNEEISEIQDLSKPISEDEIQYEGTLVKYKNFAFLKKITERPVKVTAYLSPKSNFEEIIESFGVEKFNYLIASKCINAESANLKDFSYVKASNGASVLIGLKVDTYKTKGNKDRILNSLSVQE